MTTRYTVGESERAVIEGLQLYRADYPMHTSKKKAAKGLKELGSGYDIYKIVIQKVEN